MIRHSGMDSIELSYPSKSSPIEGPLPSSQTSTSDTYCQPRDSISYLHPVSEDPFYYYLCSSASFTSNFLTNFWHLISVPCMLSTFSP